MSPKSESDAADDADGLEAAEEAIDEEPGPGLGPGAEDGEGSDASDDTDDADGAEADDE